VTVAEPVRRLRDRRAGSDRGAFARRGDPAYAQRFPRGFEMLAQFNVTTTNSGVLEQVIAVLFLILWIVLIALFIEMAINVRKIRKIMQDRSRPLP
jgi:hypothetical protein